MNKMYEWQGKDKNDSSKDEEEHFDLDNCLLDNCDEFSDALVDPQFKQLVMGY